MKTTVWIRLDVEVRPGAEDPFEVVDDFLDVGELQDHVNDGDGLRVVSALSLSSDDVEATFESATDNGVCSYCEAQWHHKDSCTNPRVRR